MQNLYKIGFVIFCVCAAGWAFGYFTQNSVLSSVCLAVAVIVLVAAEVLEYLKTNRVRHMIIPAIVAALCILLF